jgi:hypothetical protein
MPFAPANYTLEETRRQLRDTAYREMKSHSEGKEHYQDASDAPTKANDALP